MNIACYQMVKENNFTMMYCNDLPRYAIYTGMKHTHEISDKIIAKSTWKKLTGKNLNI